MRGPSSWHAGTSNANKPLGGAFGHGGYYSYANDKRRGRSGDVNMKAYFFLVRKLHRRLLHGMARELVLAC